MTPDAVVGAITATAGAVRGVCDVLLSPEGQASMKQWREDGQEFRRVMNAVGAWFSRTFSFAVAVEDGKVKVTGKAG